MVLTIDNLRQESPAREHLFAALAYPLLNGRAVDGRWLQISKLNNPKRENDDAIYEVDYGLLADEVIAGYIDVECKVSWQVGGWPYRVTNIAKHPMAQWQRGQFTGRLTNKLHRFREKPALSFWVGMRKDWQACWVVNAATLFEHGTEASQPTGYSPIPLPVIQITNALCAFCDNADTFTDYIIAAYRSAQCQQLTLF